MVSPKCVIVKRVNQAWELSTKMQISAAVKLIFHGGGKNVCGKKIQGYNRKRIVCWLLCAFACTQSQTLWGIFSVNERIVNEHISYHISIKMTSG